MKKLLITAFAVCMAVMLIACGGKSYDYGLEEGYEWPQTEMANTIPKPEFGAIEHLRDSSDSLRARIENVSSEEYAKYVSDCKEKGFTIEAEETSDSYEAYNESGYHLSLKHRSDGDLSIDLDAPIKMSNFVWPDSTAGKMVPQPESTFGKIEYEYDNRFEIYLGNMTLDDYDQYVQACKDAGFSVDFRKDETSYSADNADGYHLSLSYEGFNIVSVRLDHPEEETPETTAAPTTEATTEAPTEATTSTQSDDKVSNRIKDCMEAYEKFIDKYCEFMKNYDPSDYSALSEYLELAEEYLEEVKKLDELKAEDLSTADSLYILEVATRCAKKVEEVLKK